MIKEAEWHRDGHKISLYLDGDQILVLSTFCPGEEHCSFDKQCIVKWFVEHYGLSVNVGACSAAAELEIAWTLVAGSSKDIEAQQVWIIPVDDFVFSAFADAEIVL